MNNKPAFDTLHIGSKTVPAVCFHKPSEPNGYLSNWNLDGFTIDGIAFNCVEQYIMYRKCMLFGDTVSAANILRTADPAAHKALGRGCSDYNEHIWAGIRQPILLRALLAKFRAHPDLLRNLLATGDAYLVECARTDTVWAIGRPLADPRRKDIAQWNGTNILGYALMEARAILRTETAAE